MGAKIGEKMFLWTSQDIEPQREDREKLGDT